MNRLFLVASIFVLGLLVGLLVLGYFAYVIETGPPDRVRVIGISNRTNVLWSTSSVATITATSREDAVAGLGYAQGSRRTWPMLLYRAAALGKLSEIAGEPGLAADRMALRLGLADGARAAFEKLSASDKRRLQLFASGVNAALADKRILREPELILSRVAPDPWEAWHSIAVERLFAWIGADAAVDSEQINVRPIREALLLHEFRSSLVVASAPPLERGLYARYVFGSSSLPVLFEARIDSGEEPEVQGACLLGTPFFVAGRAGDQAWSFMLTSEYRVVEKSRASGLRTDRRRLIRPDGSETLVPIVTDSLGVVLDWIEFGNSLSDDSLYSSLSWSGLGAVSDASRWMSYREVEPSRFRLFEGAGITLDNRSEMAAGRGWRSSYFLIVGEPAWTRFAVVRLDTLAAAAKGFYPRRWFTDTYSTWARGTSPQLVAVLDSSGLGAAGEAAAYLRNWDFKFDGASIAAAIFAVWAETAFEAEGAWPGVVPVVDGSEDRRANVASSREWWDAYFQLAVARLTSDYGSDLSTWRWERISAGQLTFPILGARDPGRSRFVPTVISGVGHPSAPLWGSESVFAEDKPLSFWEGWTAIGRDEWVIRRLLPETNSSFRGSFDFGTARVLVSMADKPGQGSEATLLEPWE